MRLNFLLATIFALAGCTTMAPPSDEGVPIAPGITLHLPTTPPFGEVQAVQLITARYQDRQESLQALVEAGGERMSVIVTLPSGPRVLSVSWSAAGIETRREAMTPESLSGEHLLSDIMTIYAPADVLGKALSGGTLAVGPEGQRQIAGGDGTVVITVARPQENPWHGKASLENSAYGYRLEINSQGLE